MCRKTINYRISHFPFCLVSSRSTIPYRPADWYNVGNLRPRISQQLDRRHTTTRHTTVLVRVASRDDAIAARCPLPAARCLAIRSAWRHRRASGFDSLRNRQVLVAAGCCWLMQKWSGHLPCTYTRTGIVGTVRTVGTWNLAPFREDWTVSAPFSPASCTIC